MEMNREPLYPQHRQEQPVIRDKRQFRNALIGVAFIIILIIRFPNGYTWMEWALSIIGIKTVFDIGNGQLILTGLPILVGMLICLRMLYRSLNRRRFITIVLVIYAFTNLPAYLVSSYQSLFASGIYALSFDKTIASCEYEYSEPDSAWEGTCRVKVENHRNKDVNIQLTLYMESSIPDRQSLGEVTLEQVKVFPGQQTLRIPVMIPILTEEEQKSISHHAQVNINYYEAIVTDGIYGVEIITRTV